MCGFVAWIDSRRGIDADRLARMRDLLAHRGPDDVGSFRSDDGLVGLGFRRLSVIDLSHAGHQPMSDDDKRAWLTFNGEVYNFAELRAELETIGHRFRSRTDSEVVLHSYLEWGERCVDRFIGMFAFAIWDSQKRTLFAARDRLGIKPLYYAEGPDSLAVASELKSLAELPGFSRELDLRALRGFLARGYICAPDTIFAGARSLPPGCTLTWSRATQQCVVRRYWHPEAFLGEVGSHVANEQALTEELDALLRSAIRYRLVSDVPLGAFLSGGIDSSLVVALMRQVCNAEVKTFTIGFRERRFDETQHAATIARHLGTTHTLLTATQEHVRDVIARLPTIWDEPFADSSQLPTSLVSRLTKDHVTVALSGDGGDELFCGYVNYLRMQRWQHAWKLPQSSRDWLKQLGRGLPFGRLQLALHGMAQSSPVQFADYLASNWRPQEIDALAPSLVGIELPAALEPTVRAPLLHQLMAIDIQRYLPNDILTKLDRATMAEGLEARVPLLDHRVVEFALRLPLHLKFRRGITKYLLRRVLERYVPRELIDRPKQGFSVPMDRWLRHELRPLVSEHLSRAALSDGLFDPQVVHSNVARFLNGRCGHLRIWSLLVFQMWRRKYLNAAS